jgi:hypothetical protein
VLGDEPVQQCRFRPMPCIARRRDEASGLSNILRGRNHLRHPGSTVMPVSVGIRNVSAHERFPGGSGKFWLGQGVSDELAARIGAGMTHGEHERKSSTTIKSRMTGNARLLVGPCGQCIMIPDIARHKAELEERCRRHDVRRLEPFGSSVSTSDFDAATSDLDFLVEFEPSPPRGTQTPISGCSRNWRSSSSDQWT